MSTIWANRLIAGDKTWAEVPGARKSAVKEVLLQRVTDGIISAEQYESITGEALKGGKQ